MIREGGICMRCNNKGQSTAHHWGWMAVVLIVFGVSAYIYSINRPDEYNKGSIHNEEHRQDWPLSIHIGEGGCASLGAVKAKELKNESIRNKAVSH